MRMRYRLKTMMIVVAAVGLVFGMGIEANRLYHFHQHYQGRAASHRARAAYYATLEASAKRDERFSIDYPEPPFPKDMKILDLSGNEIGRRRFRSFGTSEELARKVAHHGELARKYDRAASRPWLPVPLDPPEPE